MADEVEFRPQMNGLVTEPSAILAGNGGLTQCENAMCKSPGLIEPRGGFHCVQSPASETDGTVLTVYARRWGGAEPWFAATNGTLTKVYQVGEAAASFSNGYDVETALRAEPFADRQCWTFEKALRMLDSATASADTLARLPGAPRAPGMSVTLTNANLGGGRLLDDGYAVAYRLLVVRHVATDVGDRIVIGAPSDRVVYWNIPVVATTGCDLTLTIPIAKLFVGDEIQIYRTPTPTGPIALPSTAPDPGDEMVCVHSYRIKTLAASYSWTDSSRAAQSAGASLYTNDTQDGLVASNYRIRRARDVAYYNGMAFYAGASRGYTKDIALSSINYGGTTAVAPFDPTKTLSSVLFSCTTALNTTLSAINPTVAVLGSQLAVGQYVNLAANSPETASAIRGFITAVNVGANTITLDTATLSAVAGNACVAWDWVGIETNAGLQRRIYAYPSGSTAIYSQTSGVFFADNGVNANALGRAFGAFDMERAWQLHAADTVAGRDVFPRLYTAANAEYPYQSGIGLRWEWEEPFSTANPDFRFYYPFEVISSKPFAFSQEVGLRYSANLARADVDGGPARLAWSKLQQPESIPLLQYNDIGDVSQPIVRIIPTADSLWIFKADGLWRCYGDTPENLVFQQFDPTCRMASALTPDTGTPTVLLETLNTSPWVRALGNDVFAWTRMGIFKVNTGGVQRIDGAIEGDIRALQPARGDFLLAGGTSGLTDQVVAFSGTVFGGTMYTYAYHTGAGTWSKWATQIPAGIFPFISGSADTDDGSLLLSTQYGYGMYRDDATQYHAPAVAELPTSFADTVTGGALGVTSCVVSAVAADGVTLTYTMPTGELMAGAILFQGGMSLADSYLVLSAEGSGGTAVVERAGILAGFPVLLGYYPIKQTIAYAATTTGAPAVAKWFKRAYFGFEKLRGGLFFRDRYRIRGAATPSAWLTEQYPTSEVQGTLQTAIGLTTDREFEAMRDVPTDESRATGLEVTLELNQACVYSAIDSMTLVYEPTGTDVGGRS